MKICYEDSEIIVVEKPAGVAVESAHVTEKDLYSSLRSYLAEKSGGSRDHRPGAESDEIHIVHRLDQVVAGLLVFAKTKEAAAALSKQLTDGTMKKMYRARVCGTIPAKNGELTDYLVKDGRNNMSHAASPGTKGAKKAVLRYRQTAEDELEIDLVTGRHHQIRVQLAHAGMPIAGDVKYGAPEKTGGEDNPGRGRIALTASRLSFRHPSTGRIMTFTLPGEDKF